MGGMRALCTLRGPDSTALGRRAEQTIGRTEVTGIGGRFCSCFCLLSYCGKLQESPGQLLKSISDCPSKRGRLQFLGPNKKVPSPGPLVGPLRESKTHISQAPTSGWCIEGATWGARQDPGLCCLCTDKETQLEFEGDLAATSATY